MYMQQRNGSQWMLSKQWGNKKTLGELFGNFANCLDVEAVGELAVGEFLNKSLKRVILQNPSNFQ